MLAFVAVAIVIAMRGGASRGEAKRFAPLGASPHH
jgi:hypothetical protein